MPTRGFSLFGRASFRLRKHDHRRRDDDGHHSRDFNSKDATTSAPCSLGSEQRAFEGSEISKSESTKPTTSSASESFSSVASAQVTEPVSEPEPEPEPSRATTTTQAQATASEAAQGRSTATAHVPETSQVPATATATATESSTESATATATTKELALVSSQYEVEEQTQASTERAALSEPSAQTEQSEQSIQSAQSTQSAQSAQSAQLARSAQSAPSAPPARACSSCSNTVGNTGDSDDSNSPAERNEEDVDVDGTPDNPDTKPNKSSGNDDNEDEVRESLLTMMKQERTVYNHLFTNPGEPCMQQPQQQQQQQPTATSTLQSEQLNNDCVVDAQWRQRIIEWMYSVVDNCNLRRDSVAVSAYYLDVCLSYIQQQRLKRQQQQQQKESEKGGDTTTTTGTEKIDDIIQINSRLEFQLCAMTALQLAIKLYDTTSLKLNCMVKLSRGAFSEQDVVQMEMKMLYLMKWYIHPPTTICFARQYLRFLFRHLEVQQQQGGQQEPQLPEQQMLVLPAFTRYLIIEITRFLSEISVCLSRFLKYPPSVIALACMLVAIEHVPTSPTTMVRRQGQQLQHEQQLQQESKRQEQQEQQLQQEQHARQQQQQHGIESPTVANSAAATLLVLLHQRQEQCEEQHQQQQHSQELLPLWYRQHIFDFLAQIIVIDDKDEHFSDNCSTHCDQLLEVFDDLQVYLETNERSLQELIHTITKDCYSNYQTRQRSSDVQNQ